MGTALTASPEPPSAGFEDGAARGVGVQCRAAPESVGRAIQEPLQRDQAKVEATVAAYVKGKTKVRFTDVWRAVKRAAPPVDRLRAPKGTLERVHGYLYAHGFTCKQPQGTYTRPSV